MSSLIKRKVSIVTWKNDRKMRYSRYKFNPGQNVWDTLCFRWGKCNSCWPSSPAEQRWVLQVKHFLHILHTLRTSTLFRWVGGKTVVKAVFTSVYRRLAVNSIERHVKKGRCPKTFWPGFLFPPPPPPFFFFFLVLVLVLLLLLLLLLFCQFGLPRYLNSERLELKMRMPLSRWKKRMINAI